VRVLVVEDERTLSARLAEALTGAGYVVDTAADGARADFLAHTEQYDAIVLDLGLPAVDGVTLLRRWRDADMPVPVLILSAARHVVGESHGIDSGADDYVTKPFQMEEVIRARARADSSCAWPRTARAESAAGWRSIRDRRG
jgi:two-component system OmpR family response regulator